MKQPWYDDHIWILSFFKKKKNSIRGSIDLLNERVCMFLYEHHDGRLSRSHEKSEDERWKDKQRTQLEAISWGWYHFSSDYFHMWLPSDAKHMDVFYNKYLPQRECTELCLSVEYICFYDLQWKDFLVLEAKGLNRPYYAFPPPQAPNSPSV